jgi:drug/metabolite transporter (DMT)-like permease
MEGWGVLAAMLSSALGGTAVGATRYLAGTLDPIAIGVVRFGGGFLLLLLIALCRGEKWPARKDWPAVASLGLLFFGLFPILFNAALIYTTAARGALALSTVPLLTMAVGALLKIDPPTLRKFVGVLIAMGGVATALGTSLAGAPVGAWRGDLLMVGAALTMALYNLWSQPFVSRSSPMSFATFGMGVGVSFLLPLSILSGALTPLATLTAPQWLAAVYLAVICGTFIFFLWAYALGKAAPTLVAATVTVNPVTAALFGTFLLGESINAKLIVGVVAVLVGILVASVPFSWRAMSNRWVGQLAALRR